MSHNQWAGRSAPPLGGYSANHKATLWHRSDLDELVAPDMIAMERAEAEMLRQEKEAWKEETARLLLDYKAMRGEKEALER